MEALMAIISIGVVVLVAIFFLTSSSISKSNHKSYPNQQGNLISSEEIKIKFRQLNRMASQIRI